MLNIVIERMIKYNGSDVRRINHVLKVLAFAQFIAEKENCTELLKQQVLYAAVLHDIGIHKAEEKYKSSAGSYQEELGPAVAKELIDDLSIPAWVKERVYFLIGNHHSYNKIDGTDFQILVEADFIVNIDEDKMDAAAIKSVRDKIFKTVSGIDLLDSLYPHRLKTG